MWIYYGIQINNMPILVRSSADISLLTISSLYIIRNKIMLYNEQISPVIEEIKTVEN